MGFAQGACVSDRFESLPVGEVDSPSSNSPVEDLLYLQQSQSSFQASQGWRNGSMPVTTWISVPPSPERAATAEDSSSAVQQDTGSVIPVSN
mmetsp:Transcript_5759/g.11431  ORF Transcript_5759/g.11431 Transcript_5759/m.11431 type:complete len:92 (-) Transcript_5759:360-635(-)